MVYVGEKPKHKMDYNGKMHTLDESEMKNVSRKPVAMRRKIRNNETKRIIPKTLCQLLSKSLKD